MAAWMLESLDGQPLIEDSFVYLNLSEYSLDGFDGCNSYGGRSEDETPVVDGDGKFSAPPMSRTEADCPETEGLMDQADAYISNLTRLDTYRVSGSGIEDRLEIFDSDGSVRLVFVRQVPLPGDPTDLEGTGWRLQGQGDALAATMYFLDDRLVTGVTACRAYQASYQGTEGNVRFPSISMLTSTHSCPEDARRAEGEFTDFLTWAREYAVSEEGGSSLLRMRSSRGRTLALEPLSPTFKDIADAEWTLVAIVEFRDEGYGMWNDRTTEVVQGTDVTISFDEDGLSGSSGCNSYTSQATTEDGVIMINAESLSHTEEFCQEPDGLMEQEQSFLDLLPRVRRYGTYGEGLFLQTTDWDTFLLFSAR